MAISQSDGTKCDPMQRKTQQQNYQRVAKAIEYISRCRQQQPSLHEVASEVGLSDYHLQRLFSEWAGISPKQFLQYLTKEHAKSKLQYSSVMESAHASGLSGSSRLHDLMLNFESVTPGEYKLGGQGLIIHYGVHDSPFGYCLIATTHRGLCHLSFLNSVDELSLMEQQLSHEWKGAKIIRDEQHTRHYSEQMFERDYQQKKPLNLLLKGTDFQLKVWEALLAIPEGDIVSYRHVADAIHSPTSVRAVASAIARNHIAYLIPCHRVIKSTGEFNQYRWGKERKQAMLVWEQQKSDSYQGNISGK